MENKKLKVLIVGAGSIGRKEIKELKNHPPVEVVGLVEINDEVREKMKSKVSKVYKDINEGIADSNPDLVRVVTPPETHCELAKIALNAGKDVYIEKIMTVSSKQSREIVELAKEKGRSVYVRRNAIYTAVYQDAWDRLDEVGEIRHLHWIEPREHYSYWSEYKQQWLKALPGGIISEHLPHAIYIIRWFMKGEPDVVDAFYNEKELHVSLKCGQITATISYLEPSNVPMLLNIVGSKGTLLLNHSSYRVSNPKGYEYLHPVIRTIRSNLDDIFLSIGNFLRLIYHYIIWKLNLNPNSIYSKSDNYRQFTDIANGGKTALDFKIDGEEGLKNVELFEKIWKKVGEIK